VPITTKITSSNPVHGEVYLISHYVIQFVSNFRQFCGFIRILRVSSVNTTDRHDITEILLKVALSTINRLYIQYSRHVELNLVNPSSDWTNGMCLQPFIEKAKFMTMFVSKVIAPFGEIRFHNLYFLCLKQFSQLVNKLSNTICIHYYKSAS
jgi:hypothetical protein